MKVRSLADLRHVRRELAERAAQAAERERIEREQQEREARERRLFELAVGPVSPLKNSNRVVFAPAGASPQPTQRHLDEAAVMREALSDEFDVETLLHTDDKLSFIRPGLGPDVLPRLRAGRWSIQRHIDLHGLRTDEAREALGRFLRECHQQGLRCVRVVHGKGLGSPGREPVLKVRVPRWLVQKSEVLAFVQARPADGGAGALLVLLRQAQGQGGN
ncbi:MAG: Smr/MutS family protein [Burkholderiaceae bacterium]